MTKIIPMLDIAPSKHRKRIIVLWDEMNAQQKRELYYGFTTPKKCSCLGVHNFNKSFCNK